MVLDTKSSISKFQETMISHYSHNSSQESKNKGLNFSYAEFWTSVFKHLLVGCIQGNCGEELCV